VNEGDGVTPPPSPPPPPPPPFNMPDMAQFWTNATQFMTTMKVPMPRQAERNETIGCSLANFFRHSSPMFDGSVWPLVAED
jgi:hypothetical protein